ncbi:MULTISPECIES: hypothetical protein [unclassified Streptomyces]|uniref:hypothetical protein n=1 Tax=unclassified Streptomyces TaxID=2593676 RepID=UPI000DC7CBF0|nr:MULTISPECIES: hypothetical protein [unclassified Streptomyces]AWZ08883.1 hypothetical protein DRB89_34940 [Streptomyces sp. ICC4]AWZ16670.1 hypothetical protein DRB96_35790 [Streptomyces sp. ICC1]
MRRRATTPLSTRGTLGTLAAAAALVLGAGGAAHASSGDLVINGRAIHEPSGCIAHNGPAAVANHTDNPVFITSGRWCSGAIIGVIHPGDTRFAPFTSNIYVP